MSPTHFKLNRRDGHTRRITFPNQPTWPTLAARIVSLYAIPLDNVGVSYVDDDNDQITLSSDQELQDFYNDPHHANATVFKFLVEDLSPRVADKILPPTPPIAHLRDTFGGESFAIEDDWQRLPNQNGFEGMFMSRNHDMGSVAGSDTSSVSHGREDHTDAESDGHSTIHSHHVLDKGKAKSSVTGSQRDTSFEDTGIFGHFATPTKNSPRSTEPIAAESTPKGFTAAPDSNAMDTDPPLPNLDPASAVEASTSLSNDVASLLTMLSNIMAAHPELAEGIRNLIANSSNGTYWNAQSDNIANVSEDFARTTGRAGEELRRGAEELRRRVEEEAGRRVADALGGIFRSLSQMSTINVSPAEPPAQGPSNARAPAWRPENETQSANTTSFWYGAPHPLPGSRGMGHPPAFPNYQSPWMKSRPSFNYPRAGWSSWNTPRAGDHEPHGLQSNTGPVPPPRPPFGSFAVPPLPSIVTETQRPGVWLPPPPPPPPADVPVSKPSPQELRAQVEAAKLLYKTEKEKYRKEREQRRLEKIETAQAAKMTTSPIIKAEVTTPTSPRQNRPVVQVVSNARGPYPQLEMFSVPRRHNTHAGHAPSRRHGEGGAEDLGTRALNRISKRLADMGFTDHAYPTLASKIKAQMPSSGVLTKDNEDDIVTTLLEELLAMSPKPAVASGSGMRERDVPGAWH